eukprot:Nk52_evm20s305 gene=Nk52_evmTU20s305
MAVAASPEVCSALKLSQEDLSSWISGSETCQRLYQHAKTYIEQQMRSKEAWKNDLESVRAEHQVQMVNAEQQLNQMERQYKATSTKLKAKMEEIEKLSQARVGEKERFEKEINELKENLARNSGAGLRVDGLEMEKKVLEEEKKNLVEVINRKTMEVERITEEWQTVSEDLREKKRALSVKESELEAITSERMELKFRVNRAEQERDLLQKQNDYLENECKSKSELVISLRKEKTSLSLKLQEDIDSVQEENAVMKDRCAQLRKHSLEEVKVCRNELVAAEENFKKEIAAQTKLTNLYKIASEEAKGRVEELQSALEGFQASTRAKQLDMDEELAESKSVREQLLAEIAELEKKNEGMARELKNANSLLGSDELGGSPSKRGGQKKRGDLGIMSPTAAATSSLIKKGMTMTEIYTQYAEASEQLQIQRDENSRLTSYLNQILKEIEERAPVLLKQRQEYENALNTAAQLTERLDVALHEGDKYHEELLDCKRECAHLERQKLRCEQQIEDVSRQVQAMLKENTELKLGHVLPEKGPTADVRGGGDELTSSDVISERLVTFRNIVELQNKNRELLGVVRELGERREVEEQKEREANENRMKHKLQIAFDEVEELKAMRKKQEGMVQAIVRQRDMYRVLLTQATGKDPELPSSGGASSLVANAGLLAGDQGPSSSGRDTSGGVLGDGSGANGAGSSSSSAKRLDYAAMFSELQSEFDSYRKEKREIDKVLNEQIDSLRSENSDLKITNAKLSSDVEFLNEKYSMLVKSTSSSAQELKASQEKCSQFSATLVEHQRELKIQSDQLKESRDRMRLVESTCTNLKTEKELWKANEKRLVEENNSLREERNRHAELFQNLQTLQNNFERVEFEANKRYEARLEKQASEVDRLQKKVEDSQASLMLATKKGELLAKEEREKCEAALREASDLKAKVAVLENDKKHLKEYVEQYESQLSAADVRLNTLIEGTRTKERLSITGSGSGAPVGESVESSIELANAKAEIASLKTQVAQAQEHVAQYKSISAANEEALQGLNSSSEEFKEAMQKEVEGLKEEIEKREGTIRELNEDKTNLMKELTTAHENLDSAVKTREDEIAKYKRKLESQSEDGMSLEDKISQLKEDVKVQAELASEASAKYDRELMLHASDVERLTTVKSQLEGVQSQLDSSRSDKDIAEQKLAQSEASWKEQQSILEEAKKMAESKCEDLVKQNELVHDQLEAVSEQMKRLQKSLTERDTAMFPGLVGGDSSKEAAESALNTSMSDQSVEDLREIVRYLRREKDILNCEYELVRQESKRFKQQFEHSDRNLRELKIQLAEERQRSQSNAQTDKEHSELLEKVNQMSLLRESNATLRSECERQSKKCEEYAEKVKSLEGQILPLIEEKKKLISLRDVLVAEKATLTNETSRWKARVQNLLEKNQKIDPEVHEKLRQDAENAKKMREEAKAEVEKANKALDAMKIEKAELGGKLKTASEELAKAKSEKEGNFAAVEARYQKLKKHLDFYKSSQMTSKEKIANLEKELKEAKAATSEKSEGVSEAGHKELQALKMELETTKKISLTEKTRADQAQEAFNASKAKLQKAVTLVKKLQEEKKALTAQSAALQSEVGTLKASNSSNTSDGAAEQAVKKAEMKMNLMKSQYENKLKQLDLELKKMKDSYMTQRLQSSAATADGETSKAAGKRARTTEEGASGSGTSSEKVLGQALDGSSQQSKKVKTLAATSARESDTPSSMDEGRHAPSNTPLPQGASGSPLPGLNPNAPAFAPSQPGIVRSDTARTSIIHQPIAVLSSQSGTATSEPQPISQSRVVLNSEGRTGNSSPFRATGSRGSRASSSSVILSTNIPAPLNIVENAAPQPARPSQLQPGAAAAVPGSPLISQPFQFPQAEDSSAVPSSANIAPPHTGMVPQHGMFNFEDVPSSASQDFEHSDVVPSSAVPSGVQSAVPSQRARPHEEPITEEEPGSPRPADTVGVDSSLAGGNRESGGVARGERPPALPLQTSNASSGNIAVSGGFYDDSATVPHTPTFVQQGEGPSRGGASGRHPEGEDIEEETSDNETSEGDNENAAMIATTSGESSRPESEIGQSDHPPEMEHAEAEADNAEQEDPCSVPGHDNEEGDNEEDGEEGPGAAQLDVPLTEGEQFMSPGSPLTADDAAMLIEAQESTREDYESEAAGGDDEDAEAEEDEEEGEEEDVEGEEGDGGESSGPGTGSSNSPVKDSSTESPVPVVQKKMISTTRGRGGSFGAGSSTSPAVKSKLRRGGGMQGQHQKQKQRATGVGGHGSSKKMITLSKKKSGGQQPGGGGTSSGRGGGARRGGRGGGGAGGASSVTSRLGQKP